jgi:hypothetical protein
MDVLIRLESHQATSEGSGSTRSLASWAAYNSAAFTSSTVIR